MPDKFLREIEKKFHYKMHDICPIDSEQRKDFELKEMRQKKAQELDPSIEIYELFKPLIEKNKIRKHKSNLKRRRHTNSEMLGQDKSLPTIGFPIAEEYTQT